MVSINTLTLVAQLIMAICGVSPSFAGKDIAFSLAVAFEVLIVFVTYLVPQRPHIKISVIDIGVVLWVCVTGLIIIICPNLNRGALFTGLLFSFVTLLVLKQNLVTGNVMQMRRLALQSIILYLIVLTRSLIIAGDNTNVFRLNRSSGMINEEIGNFGIYYSAIFILPIGIYLIYKAKGKTKYLGFAALAISALLIVRASTQFPLLLSSCFS